MGLRQFLFFVGGSCIIIIVQFIEEEGVVSFFGQHKWYSLNVLCFRLKQPKEYIRRVHQRPFSSDEEWFCIRKAACIFKEKSMYCQELITHSEETSLVYMKISVICTF